MWDPNETLASWARDDDVLSWRSLDTLRGTETGHFGFGSWREDAAEDESDVSDLEELAEVFEKRTSRLGIPQQPSVCGEESRPRPTLDKRLEKMQDAIPRTGQWTRPSKTDTIPIHDQLLRELPSTSEMSERLGFTRDGMDSGESHGTLAVRVDALQRSPGQVETRRGPMTLGDLLAKKNAASSAVLPPPPPVSILPTPVVLSPPPPPIDPSGRLRDHKVLERQCQDLAEKDRHLQTVLAKQLHQIETMEYQLRQQESNCQNQQLDLNGLRESTTRFERQTVMLQTSLREKDQALEKHTQLLVLKTNEFSTLETKVRSLQITNESFQEQARKATEEKEKAHKDYLQVVYDLGKLQKQMNAAAKETVNIAEKDLLLREIDQLRHEKDQLATKLRESEARTSSLLQNNAAVEAQKVRELQTRVRELEEDLHRARNGRPGQMLPPQSGSYPPALQASSRHAQSSLGGYPSASPHEILRSSSAVAPHMPLWGSREQPGIPSLLSGVQSGSMGTKPMTLKAIARRSTSIGDVLRQQPMHELADYSFSAPPTAALAAPFATEKQTLLHDSLQKRDLEQKLLKLHVEKEQMEAKLVKVEQTGLKTMSARTEKTWVEGRLRDLTLEIGRLKLTLR